MDVTPQRLREEMKKGTSMTLIDLQTAEKYLHAHIPGAVNIPADALAQNVESIVKDKDAVIVVYGEFDELGKGSTGAQMLEQAGYQNVGRVVGGLMGWQEAGYPVEGGAES